MKKNIIILGAILFVCNPYHADSSGTDMKTDKIFLNSMSSSMHCFAANNQINNNKKLSDGKASYLYMDNLVRESLGGIEVNVSEHVSIYLGEILISDNTIIFIPDNADNKFMDEKKKFQSKVLRYISQVNADKHLDMTEFIITSKWHAQYKNILTDFRQNTQGTFSEYSKKKIIKIKQETPKCIVKVSDIDFINALDISLIQKYSATLKGKK